MAFCPADCADVTITPNVPECEPRERNKNISRLGFFTCDTDIPNPVTQESLEGFVTAGKLSFTSPLSGVDMQDPEYVDLDLQDCRPARSVVSGRTLTFMDKFGIDIPATTSPVADPIPYYNQDFWNDKLSNEQTLRYIVVFCDGSFVIAKDENGTPIEASLKAYLKQENIGSAASKRFIQYIMGEARFQSDPLALYNKPETDGNGVVLNMNGWGLF